MVSQRQLDIGSRATIYWPKVVFHQFLNTPFYFPILWTNIYQIPTLNCCSQGDPEKMSWRDDSVQGGSLGGAFNISNKTGQTLRQLQAHCGNTLWKSVNTRETSYCISSEETGVGRAQTQPRSLWPATQELAQSPNLMVSLYQVMIITLFCMQNSHSFRVLIGTFCNLDKQEWKLPLSCINGNERKLEGLMVVLQVSQWATEQGQASPSDSLSDILSELPEHQKSDKRKLQWP